MKIQFIGAAHEVTGSCTLLSVGKYHYLVDFGMEQGIDFFENINLPIPPSMVDAVFLTHAHIDHSGMLPKLYKDGFKGAIYSTRETASLCDIMLRDSAHIQESEAEWHNRKAERRGEEKTEPVYTMADAIGVLKLFRPVEYKDSVMVSECATVRFVDVGHLLGSAAIELFLREGEEERKIVFSGDVGNINQPIIKNPETIDEADYLVVESTYGNRLHEKAGDVIEELTEYIKKTFERGGNIIIPSFAVGRTQEMLYAIRQIKLTGALDGYGDFPVYVDSPLATEATGIFLQCDTECLDEETMALVKAGINPIWFDGLTLSVSADDSKAINEDKRPKIIISASGMCEAGRIRHHLKHNLWKSANTVLFVGYQAENSLGRILQNGAKRVKLFGEEVAVRAEIATLHGTSGHADRDGLMNWVYGFRKKPKTVFVNHGDDDSCVAFKNLLSERGYFAQAPFSGSEYDLIENKMTVFADSKPLREKRAKEVSRNKNVHDELLMSLEKLTGLVEARRNGMSNKDKAKLSAQIKSLVEKWK